MAITSKMARLILIEHKFRPIKGEVLLLGRQTVFLTVEEAKALINEVGIPLRQDAFIALDKSTMGRNDNFITDKSFFSLFSDAVVFACDVSDYEGADYIFDLCNIVPDCLINRFNFIYNGSVLDNVFDPANSMKHVTKMLKSDGVVFHYEGLKHSGSTYLKFTPEWFFDYYAVNKFDDCQLYLLTYQDYFDDYSVVQWDAFINQNGKFDASPTIKIYGEGMVVCVAQKGENSSSDVNPIQFIYRQNNENYIPLFEKSVVSGRRSMYDSQLSSLTTLIGKRVPDKDDWINRIFFKVKRKIMKMMLRMNQIDKTEDVKTASYPHEFYTLGHKTIGII